MVISISSNQACLIVYKRNTLCTLPSAAERHKISEMETGGKRSLKDLSNQFELDDVENLTPVNELLSKLGTIDIVTYWLML